MDQINIQVATINAGATPVEAVNLSDRVGIGIPVPFFRPPTTNTAIAFDLAPNGSPTDFTANTGVVWIDICSTDCTGQGVTNYETLRLGKFSPSTQGGAVHLSSAVGGNGVVRPMILQLNGGSVGINSLPAAGVKLSVPGNIGASEYCDPTGANCVTSAQLNSLQKQIVALQAQLSELQSATNTTPAANGSRTSAHAR